MSSHLERPGGQRQFPAWKRAIFCQIKEVEHLRGDIAVYVAQANAQIDAELAKKGRFQAGN